MFGFEKLEAWKLAIEYAGRVYDVTERFPNDERFGLTNQLRRAAVSISANVAEGSGRGGKDFARFIGIAYSSLVETVSHMHVAKQRRFLSEEDFESLYSAADRIARVLSGLRSSVERSR